MERFVVRPDSEGFSVIDLWSGEPIVVAMARQTGLPQADAAHMASLLNLKTDNRRTAGGGVGAPLAALGLRR